MISMDEVTLSGTAFEIGHQYGTILREHGFEPPEVTPTQRQFVIDCLPYVERAAPGILDELRGIADAGDWNLERIRAIPIALGWDHGCTVVSLSGEHCADGRQLFGRNYDFSTEFADFATMFRTQPARGFSHVGCSDHWTGRHDGVNEAGLAIGHSFVPHRGLKPGLMFSLAARTVLETCQSVGEAVAFLEDVTHARNTNFLLADGSGAIAVVEASPETVTTSYPQGFGVVTNHFQSDSMTKYEQEDGSRSSSKERQASITEWVESAGSPLSLSDLKQTLSDTETGVCACSTPDESTDVETLWSWAIALDGPEAFLSHGRPDRGPYTSVDL
ncbi:C45 family autoproteolytic acyltransferase/hydolase [Haloarchaeobius amylolyticus]|uniref:C45 family autoproteolytic acyltransferase/hydolase n=1 Tax=Haloarchaeobius amylolyticus TaxID=1198296 RepID=UPI00226DA4F6|nr:C45 family peptidase [Haloarchaeobius amylolyticus]